MEGVKMTFLELQNQILQTRKARNGIKNRIDYCEDVSYQERMIDETVYRKALHAANQVVSYFEKQGRISRDSVSKTKMEVKLGKDNSVLQLKKLERQNALLKQQVNDLEITDLHIRNVEKQNEYLQQIIANLKEEIKYLNKRKMIPVGRPKGAKNKICLAKERIQAWKIENPDSTKSACARDLKLSRQTVIKYWG